MCIKNKNLMIIIAAFLTGLAMLCFYNVSRYNNSVFAADILGGEIASTYMIGDTLNIPSAKLVYQNNEFDAVSVVYYPDGRVTGASSIILDETGHYRLEYKAVAGKKLLSHSVFFQSANYLYEVSGSKSTLSYGSHSYAPQRQGIVLSLANGETFNFNKIIDLSGKKSINNIIRLFVTPEKIGKQDANIITVTFTDAYNSDNNVTVTAKIYDSDWVSETGIYLTANAAGQLPTGIEPYSGTSTNIPVVMYQGGRYRLHQNNEYGSWAFFSMLGTPRSGGIGDEFLEISWDYEKRQIFGGGGNMVVDLDETLFFNELWNEFTTGEVYVSISASGYQTSAMNMVITNIAGEDLSLNSYIDNKAPDITVEYGDYSQSNIPNAVIDKPYPVFMATAFDSKDGELSVSTKVFFNYYSSSRVMVELDGNIFVPRHKGLYTVVYSATDRAGNVAVKTADISAIVQTVPLSAELGSKQTVFEVGQQATVAAVQISSMYSVVKLDITAIHSTDSSVRYTVDTQSNSFRPLYAGNYTIEYTVADYIETVTFNYSITVENSDKSVFIDEVTLPKYFIKNAIYTLPSLLATAFENGRPVSIPSLVSVKEDSLNNGNVTQGRYKVNAQNHVTVIYSAPGGGEKKYENIPVVDTGYGGLLNLNKYFYGTAFNATAMSDHILYQTNSVGTGLSLEYINYLLADSFSFSFDTVANKSNFGKINIYLNDSHSQSVLVKFSYRKAADGTYFSVNNGIEYRLDKIIGEASPQPFLLKYDESSFAVSPVENLSISVRETLNGGKFSGFQSSFVSLRIELDDVTQSSQIKIININNQPFSRIRYDIIPPVLIQHRSSGYADIGQEIVIPPSLAADVLDPDIVFSMNVKGPDGQFITDINGRLLNESIKPDAEYRFIAGAYGRYTVNYSVSDTAGEVTGYSYVINVVDVTPPQIVLTDTVLNVAIGGTVTIAQSSYSDNVSAQIEAFAYLKLPINTIVRLSAQSFVANIKGRYTVTYYAYDGAGNVAIASYDILCE